MAEEQRKRYPNVLLEKVPEVADYETTFKKLRVPTHRRDDAFWESSLEHKLDALDHLRQFYIPTGQHVLLAQGFLRLLRAGLARRDPQEARVMKFLLESGEIVSRHNRLATALTISRRPIDNGGALGFTLMGPSGAGKTSLLDRFCWMLPQEPILIESIAGKACRIRTVPVIRVQCPTSGTKLGFCYACLSEIDSALGDTHYAYEAKTRRYSSDMCEVLLRAVLSSMFVGLVIVDDIQFLLKVPNQATILLQCIANLMEDTGIPVLTVGTYMAWSVLKDRADLSSKLSSEGDEFLEAMPLNSEWVRHCGLNWKLRVTDREMIEMPPWFATRCHFLTCGIPRILRILLRSYFSDLLLGKYNVVSSETLSLSSQTSLRRLAPLLYALRCAGAGDVLTETDREVFAHYLPPQERDTPSLDDQEKYLADLAKRKEEDRKQAASGATDENSTRRVPA